MVCFLFYFQLYSNRQTFFFINHIFLLAFVDE